LEDQAEVLLVFGLDSPAESSPQSGVSLQLRRVELLELGGAVFRGVRAEGDQGPSAQERDYVLPPGREGVGAQLHGARLQFISQAKSAQLRSREKVAGPHVRLQAVSLEAEAVTFSRMTASIDLEQEETSRSLPWDEAAVVDAVFFVVRYLPFADSPA
jgi:hypothetical protein